MPAQVTAQRSEHEQDIQLRGPGPRRAPEARWRTVGRESTPGRRPVFLTMTRTPQIETLPHQLKASQRLDQVLGVFLWLSLLAILLYVG